MFPKLLALSIVDEGVNDDRLDEMAVLEELDYLSLPRGASLSLNQKLLTAFPNLAVLEVGSPAETTWENESVELFKLLAVTKDVDGVQVPVHWPGLCRVQLTSLTLDKAILLSLLRLLKARFLRGVKLDMINRGQVSQGCNIGAVNCFLQWDDASARHGLPLWEAESWPEFKAEVRSVLRGSVGLNSDQITQEMESLLD